MTAALNPQVIVQILELLESDKKLKEISKEFREKFPDTDSHLDICKAIGQLLQQSDLLDNPEQQVVAIYMIHAAFSDLKSALNPFIALLVRLLHPTERRTSYARLPLQGRWFLSTLLASNTETRSVTKITAKQILAKPEEECVLCDTSNVEVALMEQLSRMSAHEKSAVPGVVLIGPPGPKDEKLRREAAAEVLAHQPTNITPMFQRLPPPLHLEEETLRWLSPECDYVRNMEYRWDDSMCAASPPLLETRRLLAKATQTALTPNQQQKLINGLKPDAAKIMHLGLAPVDLQFLVENNPAVAVETLIMLRDHPHAMDYYYSLVRMDLSLHSMEVVNRLTTESTVLPAGIITRYVSKCIESCERMNSRFTQSRHVRLVCVFLSSLIRNRLIDLRELFIEVQAFCIEFSKIKEAASLFRLLRTVYPPPDD